ncbi:efflux RND transporter periplasmic adaptor subunit [Methylobacterium sp. E-046]|uniref:efflux RND transporter periplasmic adaptor subunit n=1 Tax=Methylobacterium sp. E-046 TaxID=2836576 RepID=UPI001FB93DAC|nr:efflux RND transporter periplasmic adaptor subunit [Methylobacterium sp. E-046]MCJ2097713.1 efflux RND transporter periplasmic adaptor subunit [Methylobacterium sp. E-046]
MLSGEEHHRGASRTEEIVAFDDSGGGKPVRAERKPSRSRGMAVVLLVLAAAGGGAYGYTQYNQPKARPKASAPLPVPVTLGTVEQGPFALMANGLGTVQAYNTVQVRTRVDGEIQQVAFREGQTVHKGDVLVQVDPRPYQATLDQAKAKKEQDTANLNNAKVDLTRYTGLGVYASRQQTETQTALVAQLTAQVASDQAAIDNATTQLGYATIRAPIDGVTGFRQVDIGNIVNAAGMSAIVTITQVEPIFVVFTAPEDQLPAITAALRKGDVPVEAWSSDGLTKLADGKLALFNNQVDTATGTIRLKAVYENKNHALWPGLSVSTKMRVATLAVATTVPDDAVQHGPSGLFAFVVDEAGRAHQVALKAGRSDSGRTQILSGELKPGERVIVAGQYKVQDGSLVADPRAAHTAQASEPDAGRQPEAVRR